MIVKEKVLLFPLRMPLGHEFVRLKVCFEWAVLGRDIDWNSFLMFS